MLAKKSANSKLVKKTKKIASTKVAKPIKPSKPLEKSIKSKGKKLIDDDAVKEPMVIKLKSKTTPKKSLENSPVTLKTKTKKTTKNQEALKEIKQTKVLKSTKSPKSKVKKSVKPEIKGIQDEFSEKIEKFHIQPDTIQSAIEGVIKTTMNNPKLKNQLFNEQYGIFLQINSFHISNQFPRILRIPLRNSILTSGSEICLIVPDVKGIPNKEHEKHLEHYEELLRKHGIDNMFKKIMTFHEFRTEYETFEMKNRLANLYDVFLVDGRISGKVVSKCGKIFYKCRKVPTSIRLNVSKLKDHINQTLSKTHLFVHDKGNSFIVEFGHNQMSIENLIENVYCILERLDKDFPGGFANVQNINIYTNRGLKIPIYKSLKKRNDVHLPKKVMNTPKWSKIVRGELSTSLNKEVIVTPTGTVKVRPLRPRINLKQSKNVPDETANKENTEEAQPETKVKKIKRKSVEKSDDTNQIKKKKIVKKTKESANKKKQKK